jgi:acylphosphatase
VIGRRVVVHGRVQGVWFRESTRRVAEQHEVAGWVRNRPDGTVEALFEGHPVDVDQVVAWCSEGPPHARVDRVDVRDEPPQGLVGFTVRT